MEINGIIEDVAIKRAKEILEILRKAFILPDISGIYDDAFKVLIKTIISQSTTEINTQRAFERLAIRIRPLTPAKLADAEIKDIEEALRVAGLYRSKAAKIKRISSIITNEFGGRLDFIYTLSLNEAREKLLKLPGVGPKTADILLLFCARRLVLPIDTHVNRVSKRLGLVSINEKRYDAIRSRLEALYHPKDYFVVHMLFITFGRTICKALKPLCFRCPLKELCPSVGECIRHSLQ
ncbi:MAG: endonuclease III [Candidatus Bathyarchaeia archaeon]